MYVHFVQASAQIDSIMKGQVRARRPNLYILAQHVSKKDIPLCHNVGQLAHTHSHTQMAKECQREMEIERERERTVVILARPRFSPLAIV